MTTPYVCHNALGRLVVRTYPRRAPFDLRRAGFVSLSNKRATDNASAAGPVILERDGAQKTQGTEAVGSSPRAGGAVTSRATEGFLQELFSSPRQQSAVPPVKWRYSKTKGPEVSEDPTSSHARHELLPPKAPLLEEQWAAFMREYQSKDLNRDPSSSDPDHSSVKDENLLRNLRRNDLRGLLLRLVRFHSRSLSNQAETLPTPAEAIRIYVKAGLMEESLWVEILWTLLGAAVKLRARISGDVGESDFVSSDIYGKRLNDLLEVWRVFVETFMPKPLGYRNATSQDTSSYAASALPDDLAGSYTSLDGVVARKAESAAFHISSQIHLPDRFLSFSPQFRRIPSTRELSAAAVLTFDLLCPDSQKETNGPPETYKKEFVQFMAKAVARKHMMFTSAQKYLKTKQVPPELIRRLQASWEMLPQRATILNALSTRTNPIAAFEPLRTPEEEESPPDANLKSSFLIKAVKSGDANAIDRVWQIMEAKLDRGIILSSLFGHFLWAYTSLRRPDEATHVWNRMIEVGCNPSQNHWLAMLRGSQQARNYNAMRDIWQWMNASGIQPGLRCWTIRIQGLVLSGQWAKGLDALDELSKVWDSTALPVAGAQRSLEHDADDQLIQLGGEKFDLLVPSILPINAAITSLLVVGKAEVIGTYLKWAEMHKIQPDTATYNILLRRAVRGHRPYDARIILAKMESSDCQPDVHTFTIIIDGLFRNAGSAFRYEGTEAQVTAVSDIFRQMKDAGIEPSLHTYSSMLDGLLGAGTWRERKQPNVAAARAVLDHMAKEGLKASPHIYTILMSHYFNLQPPDLASIDALWNRMQLDGGTPDHILYDRIIEGYARVGAVEKMLAFLRRMPQEGKIPGWVALHAVLQSLVKAQEWDMVQDLVRDVGGKDGVFRNASRFSRGRQDFWDLVDDLRRRGIELPAVEGDEQM